MKILTFLVFILFILSCSAIAVETDDEHSESLAKAWELMDPRDCIPPSFSSVLSLYYLRRLKKIWTVTKNDKLEDCKEIWHKTKEFVNNLPKILQNKIINHAVKQERDKMNANFILELLPEERSFFEKTMKNMSTTAMEKAQILSVWGNERLSMSALSHLNRFLENLVKREERFKTRLETVSLEARKAYEQIMELRRQKQKLYGSFSNDVKKELIKLWKQDILRTKDNLRKELEEIPNLEGIINQLHVIEWEHLNLQKFYPFALMSSWSVRGLLYPMTVLKSRLQLQRQNTMYKGTFDAFRHIVKNEGFTALYRGFWITLPQLSVTFLYSSIYESLRGQLSKDFSQNSAAISAMAGGVASLCAQLVFCPTDLIAQFMMIAKNPQAFTGGTRNLEIIKALKNDGLKEKRSLGLRVVQAVYKVDGFKGFYRGYGAAILLNCPASMVFWSSYYNYLHAFKSIRKSYIDEDLKSAKLNLIFLQSMSGALAGATSAVCTNPLDVLRIRIQVQRAGYSETIRRLYKFEGFRVFTKGLAARSINSSIYSLCIMMCYETAKRLSVLPEYEDSVVW
uniref:Mitochondrial carrier protein n=1 Tax=Rhabditophanes sp. KR3021 TaxID=114890 RepID=A0AC35TLW3_9BILA